MKVLGHLLVCTTVLSALAMAPPATTPLSEEEARKLLMLLVEPEAKPAIRAGNATGASCFAEHPPKLNAQVYFDFYCKFMGTPSTVGSATIGSYMVNRWTADVWDLSPALLESPYLGNRRKELRLRHGITQKTIDKYRDAWQFVQEEPRR